MPASPLQLDLFGERTPASNTPAVTRAKVPAQPVSQPASPQPTSPQPTSRPAAWAPALEPAQPATQAAPSPASGTVTRVFLDWSAPALPNVAAWLVAGCGSSAAIDLRATIVALPTSRAARRLLELLVASADLSGRPLFPPKLVTAGMVPDVLAASSIPLAGTTTRRVVWAEALRSVDAEIRARVVAHPPGLDDWAAWVALGKVLDDLHAELAKAELSFGAVAALGVTLDEFPDEARWLAMETVAVAYAARMTTLGLADPQLARAAALAGALTFERPGTSMAADGARPLELVLACVPDLAPATRRLVDRLCADDGARVTALIFAPEALADRFDARGCILAPAWTNAPVPIDDDALVFAEGPDDQAAHVVSLIAELSAPDANLDQAAAQSESAAYAAEDIVLGAPDAEVVPFLIERLEDAGLPGRNAAGTPAKTTAPARFLREAAAWVARGELVSLAALVRHPDVERKIAEGRDVISPIDKYNTRHVQRVVSPSSMTPSMTPSLRGDAREVAGVRGVLDAVNALVTPLRAEPRPLAAWAEPIAKTLLALYGGDALHPTEDDDRLVAGGIAAIRSVLRELHALAAGGEGGGAAPGLTIAQRVDAESAIRIVLDAIDEAAVPPSAEHAAIEVLGWLELPLDDSPALLITGFVEGRLPGSVNADPFLPDRLRAHLGLDDNALRHARDAYALQAVLASRPYVRLIAGRRDGSGTPLAPSRLALGGDPDTVARRLLEFYGEGAASAVPISRRLLPGQKTSAIRVPQPPAEPGAAIDTLGVTAFRAYLACPYRFWLQYVARLRPLRDDAVELDALLFGSLAHQVLCDFGESEYAASRAEGEIAHFLQAALAKRMAESFGDGAFPAVRVQAAQLAERLQAFATKQARWAAEGKRIVAVELGRSGSDSATATSATAPFVVDGEPFSLAGRIDRIDQDERTGALYVLDYKLSETARPPDKAHRKSGRWIDLQLPLYRHLLRAYAGQIGTKIAQLGEPDDVHLGYVVLPRDVRETKFELASWSKQELAEADEVAAEVVRDLRRGRFWPPSSPAPDFSEAYADICQDARLGAAPSAPDESPNSESEGVDA